MISPKGLSVKIYSITGALVADYYSNTGNNSSLGFVFQDRKVGGLDEFSFSLANDFNEPLFNDMECRFFVDGVHWFSGFARTIPKRDSTGAAAVVRGLGFVHKLKNVVVNKTYTAQTLDFIVKDICSSYLGPDLNVLYDVANITVPVISGLDMEFNDKILYNVFETLLELCNFDFDTDQYRFWVDKDKYLFFDLIPNELQEVLFEGYHFQDPEVEEISDKIVNSILTYRTTAIDPKATEYLATYSDADSIANYGLFSKKVTFPDYLSLAAAAGIIGGIINHYKEPLVRMEISDLIVNEIKEFGYYRLINQRLQYFRTISSLETLTGWDVSGLSNSIASISTDQVFTNRKAMKLVSSVGSAGGIMFFPVSPAISFPTIFRGRVFKENAGSQYTFIVSDTFGNSVNIPIGQNNEPINEWIKFSVRIGLELATGFLSVDKDVGQSGNLILDFDASNSGRNKVDILVVDGILNVAEVKLVVDSDIVATSYFDQLEVEVTGYKEHTLVLESVEYELGKAYTAALELGDDADSLIDEILKGGREGSEALSIVSKQ